MDRLNEIQRQLILFRDERNWLQFHSPKNLAMAICGEAGELIEHFQWVTEEQSYCLEQEKLQQVAEELADIQLYLLLISERLGVDIVSESEKKIIKNSLKYPIDKSFGKSTKYTEL